MNNGWKLLSLFLVVALVVMTLKVSNLSNREGLDERDVEKVTEEVNEVESVDREAIALDVIMTRSSVRSYSDRRIEPEKIETLLRAGMAAPTAGNRQPWEFYVINDREIIKQLTNVTKYAAPMNEMALTAIVVCGDPTASFPSEPRYWVQDTSAATENILLAAHAMGLGAVWCGVYPVEERVATLREMMSLPENLIPLNFIMMGYPDKEPIIKDKWKPEKVHYIVAE